MQKDLAIVPIHKGSNIPWKENPDKFPTDSFKKKYQQELQLMFDQLLTS